MNEPLGAVIEMCRALRVERMGLIPAIRRLLARWCREEKITEGFYGDVCALVKELATAMKDGDDLERYRHSEWLREPDEFEIARLKGLRQQCGIEMKGRERVVRAWMMRHLDAESLMELSIQQLEILLANLRGDTW